MKTDTLLEKLIEKEFIIRLADVGKAGYNYECMLMSTYQNALGVGNTINDAIEDACDKLPIEIRGDIRGHVDGEWYMDHDVYWDGGEEGGVPIALQKSGYVAHVWQDGWWCVRMEGDLGDISVSWKRKPIETAKQEAQTAMDRLIELDRT